MKNRGFVFARNEIEKPRFLKNRTNRGFLFARNQAKNEPPYRKLPVEKTLAEKYIRRFSVGRELVTTREVPPKMQPRLHFAHNVRQQNRSDKLHEKYMRIALT